MSQGQVIFLNGTSSSGKTELARELQATLDPPYLYFSVDDFIQLLPQRCFQEENLPELAAAVPALLSGMHRAVAAFASAGNYIIVDHVLQEPGWLEECVEILAGYPVLFVGLHCPLEELERRERQRDREPGTARYQFDRVHRHQLYDLEIDSSKQSSAESARRVRIALGEFPSPSAFEQLRARLAGGAAG